MQNTSTIPPTALEHVFRALPGMYLVLATDFTILEATDMLLRKTMTTRQQLIGQHLFALFPDNPDNTQVKSKEHILQSLQEALAKKEEVGIDVLRYDIPMRSEDGVCFVEHFWNVTNVPILDETGEVQYLLHEARDITGKVLNERRQQHNQEYLNLISSATKAVSWEYDMVHNRMSWGEGLQELFGYTPADMGPGGESWDSRVHPDDFEHVQQSMQEALEKRQTTWTGEYRFRKADGSYAYVLDQGYTAYDAHGKPVRTIGSIIDITQNKSTEKALKESDARFRHLLEVLPHMAWTASPQGRVLFFNQNWYSYTGMRQGQTDGWISAIHPEDSAMVLTAWHHAVASGQSYEVEHRIRHYIDGSYRWFLERGMPMHDAQGNITLWIGTYTDIEAQKQVTASKEEDRLENMLRQLPVHLCILQGPAHICQYITPSVYKLYGKRNYLGSTAREIWPELEPLNFFDMLQEVYQKGRIVHINEYKTAVDYQLDGNTRDAYLNFKYQPLFDSDNQVEGIMISAIDVTNLVKARQRAESMATKES